MFTLLMAAIRMKSAARERKHANVDGNGIAPLRFARVAAHAAFAEGRAMNLNGGISNEQGGSNPLHASARAAVRAGTAADTQHDDARSAVQAGVSIHRVHFATPDGVDQ
jgi:hypothetical protein